MSDALVSRALERLRRATELDSAGDLAHAVDEYDAGVVLLARAMALEKDPDMRNTLCTKCGEYADRADLLRSTLEQRSQAVEAAPMTEAEREQADLEARLRALKISPGGSSHATSTSSSASTSGISRASTAPSLSDVITSSSLGEEDERSIDEQAEELVQKALAEVREEERQKQQQRAHEAAHAPAPAQAPSQAATSGTPTAPGTSAEDDGWEELEARAEMDDDEDYGLDDDAVRAMIADSRDELERVMRMEDPKFCWDDYDLPDDMRDEMRELEKERQRTREEQQRYLDGLESSTHEEQQRRQGLLDITQKKLDAVKSYIARYKHSK